MDTVEQRSDEENGTESIKMVKRLMRERGDFLGVHKGMQLVSDPKFKHSG